MKAGSGRTRKRKSAALESTYVVPVPLAIKPPGPPRAGEGDGGAGRGADRLSSLPDAVLGEIISLLTTKEGARTRILASRWRDLWLSAPLNLDCRDLISGREKSLCSAIVSRILSSHHGPGRRFCVNTYTHNVPEYTVEAWLRSTALDNLEELDFTVNRLEQPHWAFIFRFSCTLRVANFDRCDLADVSFQGLHFPMLKQLGLVRVTISEPSLHTLILGCPSLECLLINKSMGGVRCLRINSLTIRTVRVISIQDEYYADLIRLEQVVIENAPCLLRLLLLCPDGKLDVSIVAAPKLETVGFMGDTHYRGQFSTLVFGSTVIQGLCVNKLITVVHSVKILALVMKNLSLDKVIELMSCFPCLEKLYIQAQPHESGPGNLWRRKHQELIKCLDLRVKTIVLANYLGLQSQVNFVTFFVLNANLLESVTLGIEYGKDNEEFLAEQRMKLHIENAASKDVQLHLKFCNCVRRFYKVTDVRDYNFTDPFAQI